MTQKTPAQMRADAEKLITPLGRRRQKLLEEIATIDAQLRPFVLQARGVEVSLRRIQDLTGISPNTVRAWESKAAQEG